MVDVLSWLNTDHGYFGSSDGPDALSSEPSSPPSGSDEGTVFQEMTELVGHTSFSLPDDASNSQNQPLLPGKRGPPTAIAEQSHTPVAMQAQKAAIANGTPTCWGGRIGEKTSEPIFDRNRKNAEAAKQNRLKKKAYLENLEAEAETLREENKRLKSCCSSYERTTKDLAEEVEYLRSVIKNQSSLSTLLQNIPNVKSVKLSSPLGKRPTMESGIPAESSAKRAKMSSSGGVCLHVAKDTVSLEFCPHCNIHAVAQQEE